MRLQIARLAANARAAARTGLTELGAALYPPLCWLCRERPAVDGFGCDEHALAPSRLTSAEARCQGCAERLPAGFTAGLCARCRQEPRGYTRLLAAGTYQSSGALRAWILALKHGGRRELACPLAAFLAAAWEARGGPPPGAVLTSVPLHALRRFERGYDQAHLLATELAERLGLEYVRTLRRTRSTPPQGAAGSSSRAANVRGAFEILARRAGRVAGRELWLLDDVVTSGATVRACAATLRRARAREISVLALARVDRYQAEDDGTAGDDGTATLGDSRGSSPRAGEP